MVEPSRIVKYFFCSKCGTEVEDGEGGLLETGLCWYCTFWEQFEEAEDVEDVREG